MQMKIYPRFYYGKLVKIYSGAQNAFVIRQGLSDRHVFLVCTICAFSDATLISLGVFGFGEIISNSENFFRVESKEFHPLLR